jgi:hypothetical protein
VQPGGQDILGGEEGVEGLIDVGPPLLKILIQVHPASCKKP